LLTASKKSRLVSVDLPVANILFNPQRDWNAVKRGRVKVAHDLKGNIDWDKFNVADFLWTHCSIVASVATTDNGYYIEPPCDELVNTNGNAWTNEVLLATFRSFIGAENYYEHIQIPELSKGKILDAVLRPVVYKGQNGGDANVYYCDILVATDRKHTDLIQRIEAGQLGTLSMGCGIAGTRISLADGSDVNIEDIQVGDDVLSHSGIKRKVTSLFQQDVFSVPLYSVKYVSQVEPLVLTGEHPVLVATRKSVSCIYSSRPCKIDKYQSQCYHSKNLPWKCAGERKPCGRNKENYQYHMKFVPISEVKKKDYVAKVFPVEIVDDERFTNDVCRLFGLYVGDGYVVWEWKDKRKVRPVGLEFCYGKDDLDIIDETESILSQISDSKIVKRTIDERSGTYVKIWDADLARLFVDNAGEGAWSKRLSEVVMHLPHEKQRKIISGMLDSDGCYYAKTKQLSWTTASRTLFSQMHLLLLRLGVENLPSVCLRKPSGFKKKYSTEAYEQYTIQISSGSSWKIWCKKNENYGESHKNGKSSELCFFYKNYYLCPVKFVSSLGFSGNVYNFAVEDDESYVVDGVAVHNCLAGIVTCSRCGKEIRDEKDNCEHIQNEIREYFTDEKGVKRIIAELCGRSYVNNEKLRVGDGQSMEFIEASWVEKPAFEGAVLNHFVSEVNQKKAAEIVNLPTRNVIDLCDELAHLRVADSDGMIVLRLAREELRRRLNQSMVDRLARWALEEMTND
jgi:hypothetical protein